MIDKRLQTEEQRQVAEREKIRRGAEIAVDQFFYAKLVILVTLLQILQKALKTPRLHGFQLRLHGL